MNIDMKQVIIYLEHNLRKYEKETNANVSGYLKCIIDLKKHPEVKKACAPQVMKPVSKEELDKRKPKSKDSDKVEDRGGIRCRFCGVDGFEWKNRNAGKENETGYKESWCLADIDTGEAHFCR